MTHDSDITQQIPLVGDLGFEHDRRCPETAILAAYADASLGSEKLAEVEDHLANCTACLNQIGFLVREEDREVPSVPTHLLDAVRESRSNWLSWIPRPALTAVAAAAVLMAAILVAPRLETVLKPAGATRPAPERGVVEPADRSVRSAADFTAKPLLLHPAEGAILKGPAVELRWEQFQNALTYSVVVVNLEGDVVWEAMSTETEITLPADALSAGRKHFFWIEAQLHGGGTVKSAPVGFQLAPD